jgi:hypothetical protein
MFPDPAAAAFAPASAGGEVQPVLPPCNSCVTFARNASFKLFLIICLNVVVEETD